MLHTKGGIGNNIYAGCLRQQYLQNLGNFGSNQVDADNFVVVGDITNVAHKRRHR